MMEQDTNLRSQVIQATDLLLKAVERLEGRPASPSVISGPSDSLSICSPYRASTSEMNKLFNWTATKRRPPKAVVSSEKIYIRPLQKNLDLSIIESNSKTNPILIDEKICDITDVRHICLYLTYNNYNSTVR